jgi:hypothetical protein
MSEEQALQVARAGEALTDEHEYRQAYRRAREVLEAGLPIRIRVIQRWFDEHYPDLGVIVTAQFMPLPCGFTARIDTTITNPEALSYLDINAIYQELALYLASLES